MSQLLATVIPLSIGAAFSPTVLAFTLFLLGRPNNPRARAAFMIAGMTVALFLLAVAATTFTVEVKKEGLRQLLLWLDLGLGLTLLYIGGRKILGIKDQEAPDRLAGRQAKRTIKPVSFILVGVIVMLTDFSSIILFIPAMRDIADSSVSRNAKFVVTLLPFIAVLLPAIVPVLATMISPKAAEGVAKLNMWLNRHGRAVNAALMLGFGVYLLWRGLSGLIS